MYKTLTESYMYFTDAPWVYFMDAEGAFNFSSKRNQWLISDVYKPSYIRSFAPFEAFLNMLYDGNPKTWVFVLPEGVRSIYCREGSQQGCTLGTLLAICAQWPFALSFNNFVSILALLVLLVSLLAISLPPWIKCLRYSLHQQERVSAISFIWRRARGRCGSFALDSLWKMVLVYSVKPVLPTLAAFVASFIDGTSMKPAALIFSIEMFTPWLYYIHLAIVHKSDNAHVQPGLSLEFIRSLKIDFGSHLLQHALSFSIERASRAAYIVPSTDNKRLGYFTYFSDDLSSKWLYVSPKSAAFICEPHLSAHNFVRVRSICHNLSFSLAYAVTAQWIKSTYSFMIVVIIWPLDITRISILIMQPLTL